MLGKKKALKNLQNHFSMPGDKLLEQVKAWKNLKNPIIHARRQAAGAGKGMENPQKINFPCPEAGCWDR